MTKMIKPNTSFTVFTVENIIKAKEFYLTYFGFRVAFENEWYLHLVSDAGIQVAFLLPNQSTQPDIFHNAYNGNGVIFSLEVEDVDSAYSEAMEKSLDINFELRSEEWGQRHFCVKDPNGINLDIVQSIEATEEYQQSYEAK